MKKLIAIFAVIFVVCASALFAQERRCIKKDGEDFWTELSFEYYDYDLKGNLIHSKSTSGYEKWFDENENEIHSKTTYGTEDWSDYDEKGNLIHLKMSGGFEKWYKYNERGDSIYFKNTTGIEYTTEYEYDEQGNIIHSKSSNGEECWYEYDKNGRKIKYTNNNITDKMKLSGSGDMFEESYEYDLKGNMVHSISNAKHGSECWYEYDNKGRITYFHSNFEGAYYCKEYDEKGNLIHYADELSVNENYEYEYNSKNQIIKKTTIIPIFRIGTVVSTTSNLKLREEESTSSKLITIMANDTHVYLEQIGKTEIIDGINSPWVKVSVLWDSYDSSGNPIEEDTEGWCYGGYLTGRGYNLP